MNQKVHNILLADDHQLILDGLVRILTSQPRFNVVATVNSGSEALRFLQLFQTDLVVTDVEMPGMSGIELLKAVKKDHPKVKVLMLTMYKEPSLAKEVINLDIDGYVLKTADQNEMIAAVDAVLSGRKYFSPDLAYSLANTDIPSNPDQKLLGQLTEREIEILALIAEGYSNKEIANKLFIALKTVDTHRTNMMRKLDIHNVAGLTRFAIQNNLV